MGNGPIHPIKLTSEKNPWLDEADFKSFRKAAEENPARMLQRWQGITDDYSFNPSAQKDINPLTKQQQLAQSLLASVQDFAHEKMIREWNSLLNHSPQEVIDGCQSLIQQHKADMESLTQDARREIAFQKFISLCDDFKNMHYSDPQFKALEKKLRSLLKLT